MPKDANVHVDQGIVTKFTMKLHNQTDVWVSVYVLLRNDTVTVNTVGCPAPVR